LVQVSGNLVTRLAKLPKVQSEQKRLVQVSGKISRQGWQNFPKSTVVHEKQVGEMGGLGRSLERNRA
jgi:hypothetical protein